MHVHSLEFAAIGPFAGSHRIDFDGLGGAALFLIDGPTGAGKSTIIDALVFALFGDVAGRTSDKQRLRSGFAPDEQDTYSEVEFSTSFGRFRVRRTPEFARTKRRGAGTTNVPSSVVLMRSVGEQTWEAVSTHKGEADSEIQRVIGLTRAQFLQTVVLPQGEFATFLSAESKDRLAVLQRIFATDLYARIEAALDAQRIEAQRARDQADQLVGAALTHVVSRLSDVDLGELTVDPGAQADPEVALALIATIESDAVARLQTQRAEVDSATAELGIAEKQWTDAVERAGAEAAVDKAHQEVIDAEKSLRQAEERQADFSAVIAAAVSVAPADSAVGAIDWLIGSLSQSVTAEQSLPQERRKVDEAGRAIKDLDEQLQKAAHQREHELPARLLALSAALQAAVAAAQCRVDAATVAETRLMQARLDGMAGELAGGLEDQGPCPVCGSLDHPSPASRPDQPATAKEVAAARGDRVQAEADLHAWRAEGTRLTTLAGVRELASQGASAGDVLDIVDGITRFQQDADRLETEVALARERRASASAHLDALVVALREREAGVEVARADHDSVAARVTELQTARAVVAATDDARVRLVSLGEALQKAITARRRWDAVEPVADVEALAAARGVLQTRALAATSARDAAEGLLGDLRTRAGQAREAVKERDSVHASTREVIALAHVVRGGEGNALAQPLSAYVVQTMFDEILEAANRRLQVMLDGHFSLQGTEQRTGSALLGQGLGLQVVDQRTDSVRNTSTLSGGESFCASLALALGLADTVRAHAGGVELGMLFIDEGFGSLDGDRLDEVMAELLRLRADGRTVGVISHVSEMKKGINERIDVTALGGRLGSTLSVSWSN